MEEMKDIILEYVIEEYSDEEDDELTYDSPLISAGIVDSFSMVSLKRFLENKYNITNLLVYFCFLARIKI